MMLSINMAPTRAMPGINSGTTLRGGCVFVFGFVVLKVWQKKILKNSCIF
jgi:hypothetical protein